MLKRPILLATAVMAAAIVLAPQSFAQTKNPNSRPAAMNQFKANTAGPSGLKCTGKAGHMTCTSKLAWVCPAGWKSCPASPGGTCCTQK